MWCKVVMTLNRTPMKKQRSQRRSLKAQRKAAIRASITFPSDLYNNLEELALQKKVSLAWVVREAADKYVEDQVLKAAKQ